LSEIEKAIEVLRKAGYYVDGLWRVDDIELIYHCNSKEAIEVLDTVFSSDSVYDEINRSIDYYANEHNLIRKD